MSKTVDLAQKHWPHLASLLTAPQTAADYNRLVQALDDFLDAGAANEEHPLAGLVTAIGALIEAYDKEQHPMPTVAGAELLRYLMDEHGLRQSDLSDVGPQSVISDILAGRRVINGRQALALAARFKVEAGTFLPSVTARPRIRRGGYREVMVDHHGTQPQTPKLPDPAFLLGPATKGAVRTTAQASKPAVGKASKAATGLKRSKRGGAKTSSSSSSGTGRRGSSKGHRTTR